ncbi:zinc-binding dehydrogenase-domain-containing protein [Aspergillus desertorum]
MATQNLPTTIRALLQPSPTSHTVVLMQRPVPIPDHSKDEHLIRVHVASPCAGELNWPTMVTIDKEIITCNDVAGVIISAPPTSPFKPGCEVYARTSYWRPGDARDYTIATTGELAHRAGNLSWVESAAVPLSAETAWQALFTHSGIGGFDSESWKGKRFLLLLRLGVWGNAGFVRGLGAAEVLDYHETDFTVWGLRQENEVDLVVDCVGGKALEDAWWALKGNGTIIGIVQPPEQRRPADLKVPGVTDKFFIMAPSGKDLQQVTKLVEEGKCWPVVDSVWSLEQFEPGYERLESGHARGKVVFDLMLNVRK